MSIINKKIAAIKSMLSIDMNTILTKTAMGLDLNEDEQFILQAHYGLWEDKDYTEPSYRDKDLPSEDESIYWDDKDSYLEGWAMYANQQNEAKSLNKAMMVKAYKGRNHTTKAHLRDKAKAGYHNGAKKEGWGRYDLWLKSSAMKSDLSKDFKSQLEDIMQEPDASFYEGTLALMGHFRKEYHAISKGTSSLYYRKDEDWKNLDEAMKEVDSWVEFQEDIFCDISIEAWSVLDNFFPEMGESWKKEVHKYFVELWYEAIDIESQHMTGYVRMCYADYWEGQLTYAQLMLKKLEK